MDAHQQQQQQQGPAPLPQEFLQMLTSTVPLQNGVQPDVYQPVEDSLQYQISILRRCWRYERGCPLVLPYPGPYIEPILTFLQDQERCIAENQYSDDERSIYELEVERIRYLVNDFHRIRLRKIELKPMYYAHDKSGKDKLSPAEVEFAEGYGKLVQRLLRTGLDGLPGKYSFEAVQYETPGEDEVALFHYLPATGAMAEIDFGDQQLHALFPNTVVVAPYDTCVDMIEAGELDVI